MGSDSGYCSRRVTSVGTRSQLAFRIRCGNWPGYGDRRIRL